VQAPGPREPGAEQPTSSGQRHSSQAAGQVQEGVISHAGPAGHVREASSPGVSGSSEEPAPRSEREPLPEGHLCAEEVLSRLQQMAAAELGAPGFAQPAAQGQASLAAAGAAVLAPHDPLAARQWEARLLSRACASLAFHIASHYHFHAPGHAPGLTPLPPLLPAPPPPAAPGGASTASTAALAPAVSPLEALDPLGRLDHLPSVTALRSVAAALAEAAPRRQQAASGARVGSARGSAADGAGGQLGTATPAATAVLHVASGAVVALSRACGHGGCYSLGHAAAAAPAAAAASHVSGHVDASSGQGLGAGGTSGGAFGAGGDAAGSRLPGVPYSGRQLSRLLDFTQPDEASAEHDLEALSALPAATAASLLLLLAAATPPSPPHHTLAAATAAAAAAPHAHAHSLAASPRVPAALLARFLRIGARAQQPLDTVRVMWALQRLQLPDAGAVLLPLHPGGDANGSDSEAESEAAAVASGREPMGQLAALLAGQLRDWPRALAALRAAPAGELYGAWQLAVQVGREGGALQAFKTRAARLGQPRGWLWLG
jgi:hypothetical protein